MVIWRISNYASLNGIGGLMTAGRWHMKGRPIVYCTLTPSTALLETLVHIEIESEDRPPTVQVLKIEVPDRISTRRLDLSELAENWNSDLVATRAIGDNWLMSRQSLLLEVPSVLAPETWNVLINPNHSEANELKIVKIYRHAFDVRFFP